MTLIRDGEVAMDEYVALADDDALPASGAVLVSLARWQSEGDALRRRGEPVGVRLRSDESPELIAGELGQIALVALEFPAFRDGRAYSYARMLRERFGFDGEIRAVGDVLMEQLHFMQRTGFNAFELDSEDALAEFETAQKEYSIWYQPTGDGRPWASSLRHPRES